MFGLTLLTFSLLVARAWSAEVCCAGVGCFSDSAPYNHLSLPVCPEGLDVQMSLFDRGDFSGGNAITVDTLPPLSADKRVVILFHGWRGNGQEGASWYSGMKDALLARDDCYVVTVSWDSDDLWYPSSASNVRTVGALVGVLAEALVGAGARGEDTWCIGHSLGAHGCGYAGRRYKLGRITGMDPAGPMFEGYPREVALLPSDADLVDVIHTAAKAFLVLAVGYWAPLGHVDFYPNGGAYQPGCWIDPMVHKEETGAEQHGEFSPACSHNRVLDLMKESVTSDCQFMTVQKCDDINSMPGSCASSESSVNQAMGYSTDQYADRGNYYLTTNGRAPWCRG